MQVLRIVLDNFTVHKHTDLLLPSSGIVTVVGVNGSGKSSLAEGVSYGYWGKTLRGASPWPDVSPASPGRVEVAGQSGGVAASRSRASAPRPLVWTFGNDSSGRYDTTTKAQQALEQLIGTWDVWRRTHVFSSQDAAHFSTATDKERKLLLEGLLGLERFDRALERCRKALHEWESGRDVLHRDIEVLSERLAGCRARVREAEQRLQSAEQTPEPPKPPDADTAAIEEEARRVEAKVREAEADAKAARQRETEALSSASGKGGDMRALQTRLALLKDRAECPTCEQPVPPAKVDDLRAQLASEEAKVREAEMKARHAGKVAREDASEAEDEVRALRNHAQTLRIKAADTRSQRDAYGAAAARKDTAVQSARDAVRKAAELEEATGQELGGKVSAMKAQMLGLQVLYGAEHALGLKGVRAHVLGQSLDGLAASATVWLTRLSYDLMVLRLSAYTEKKSGDGLRDAISIRCGRRSDGENLREYDSLSGGERRRVDVSLLLALSEVAAAAHGRVPGTLWFDEVFDALDPEGVEAVSEALADLARTRCVVVISHNPDLVAALPASVRWRAENGTLRPDGP